MKGIVKWFNNPKGYGFIYYGSNNETLIHYSKKTGKNYKLIDEIDVFGNHQTKEVKRLINYSIEGE